MMTLKILRLLHKPLLALLILASMATAYARPVTQYEYDANGNPTKLTDPLSNATTQDYDSLNRPVQQNQPNPGSSGQLGQIKTEYDTLDQVTKITDPRNLDTTYTINALRNVTTQVSPDTGTTTNTYDAAGNLLTQTDAKSQITTYTYDALNRLATITYHDSTQVIYQYDTGTNGLGRLTGITDPTGTTAYTYDNHGRITSEARTISSVTYTTSYTYNSAGQLATVTYPSGTLLTYSYDGLGRVNQITATISSVTQTLVSNVTYQPFGGIKSFTFGNGATYTRGIDSEARLSSYNLGAQTINVGYDLVSRITSATDSAVPTDTRTFAYDNLDRLTTFTAPTTSQAYGYDLTGNRNALTIGASNYTNTVASTSNRLTAMTGPTAKTFTFDNNGSITGDTVNQFHYDTRGRLVQAVTSGGNVDYGINALGQRITKTTGGVTTVYHYDLQGKLIAESDAAGTVSQEIVYLNDIPLAVLTGQTQYIYTDQLNTPRLITDTSNNARWNWVNDDPFANNPPNDNPSGLGTFTFNQRFPGQYFDQETNLHYNYFRDYGSDIGRYYESDPIGLAGGINGYAYVNGNPLIYADPRGLSPNFLLQFLPAPILNQVVNLARYAGPAVGSRAAALALKAYEYEVLGNLALTTTGTAAALLAAGYAGYEIGTGINRSIESRYGQSLGGLIYDLSNGDNLFSDRECR